MTDKNGSTRRFSAQQKHAALLAYNGRCAQCGVELQPGWHSDHITAASKGGATDLDNAQPLCEQCNIEKGAKSVMPWPEHVLGFPPRRWQEEAFELAVRCTKRSILVQAQPGAGKTLFGGSLAKALMQMGFGVRVLVVSPSVNLREGWADDFALFGIDLDPDTGAREPDSDDCVGRSVTYASLAKSAGRISGADTERMRQRDRATIVVLDEIHHAAEDASWGAGLQHACERAAFVLCLSGTPFRSDGRPLPFVEYNNDGKAVADYVYTYAQSIQDDPQVCRQVYFPSYEGDIEWLSQNELHQSTFGEKLDDRGQSERLRAALWSEDWVRLQLEDARQKLSQIRVNHPGAGGLIVAMDQNHANFLADVMDRVSSSRPLVIASDDRKAHEKLREFKDKADPWVIAIKMISEGVNIPRLRVCCYMSNVVTDMFFRQVVGRILRFIKNIKHQEAYMFIPADKRLVDMALAMRSERIAAIQAQDDDPKPTNRDGSERSPGGFRPLGAEGRAAETISFDGETYTVDEIESARTLARHYGISAEVMARIIRDGAAPGFANGASHAQPAATPEPLYKRKRKQRSDEKTKRMRSEIRSRWLDHIANDDEAYKLLNRRLNRAAGAKSGSKTEAEQARIKGLLEAAIAAQGRPSWL